MFSVGFFIQAIFLAIAIAMDCFTVSITCGMQKSMSKVRILFLAFSFGFFQALMPFIGSLLGGFIYPFIESISHWIAFTLLFIIGLKMIMEARHFTIKSKVFDVESTKVILLLSIATSIDALAVGTSFEGMGWRVGEQLLSLVIISFFTFIFTLIGEKMGEKMYFIKPRLALSLGGFILIIIGLKTLLSMYIS